MIEPRPGEVIVEVAGAALGVEPQAEIAGRVVSVGEAARDWLGRRVVVPRILPCGDCTACRRGRVSQCPSRLERHGLSAHEAVPARWLTSVEPPLWPEGVELWQLAALADAALAPFTALARAGVGPSDSVVVVGRDARARFAAAIAVAKGARVTVDDGRTPPQEGAIVLACGSGDRARALALVANGVTVALLDGAAATTDDAVASARADVLSLDGSALVAAEAHLLGVTGGHPDLLPELCALAVRGQLPLADAVRRIAADDGAALGAAHAAYVAHGGALPIAVRA